jgi:hypothetical protein
MFGSLLRRLVIWPIPPRYSGHALAIVLVTAALVGLGQAYGFIGVLAAAIAATALVVLLPAIPHFGRRTD